ncbi:HAD family hydrolase [Loigolactobacillus binensis]|uniref:HAD family hydrolase n=1 Tax=Loigolactobacillus binensis TaxID=2559922 RepID=A0ABW3EET6_9LACO|nr:HAD family hydrolase [Loigolactobacillus binensis]
MKAILFDLDDTLYDQLQPFRQAFTATFAFKNVPLEKLYRLSRQLSDQVFTASTTGAMSMTAMYIYRIQKALAHFDHPISAQQAQTFQQNYQHYQQQIQLLPDVIATLNYCQAHQFGLGIITNGPTAHQEAKIAQLGLQRWIKPSQIIISGAVRVAKPAPQIFQLTAARLHLTPATTYFVGDSFANDIVGAKQAGWHTIWLNRRQHQISDASKVADYIVPAAHTLTAVIKTL